MSVFKSPFVIGNVVRLIHPTGDSILDDFLNSPRRVINVKYRGLFRGWNVYIENAEGFGFHSEIFELVKG